MKELARQPLPSAACTVRRVCRSKEAKRKVELWGAEAGVRV